MKHYKDIHLDIDMIFENKTAFLLAISQESDLYIVSLWLPVLLGEYRTHRNKLLSIIKQGDSRL